MLRPSVRVTRKVILRFKWTNLKLLRTLTLQGKRAIFVCPYISNMEITFPTGRWDTEDTASECHPRGLGEEGTFSDLSVMGAEKHLSLTPPHINSDHVIFAPKHPLKTDHEGLRCDLLYFSWL